MQTGGRETFAATSAAFPRFISSYFNYCCFSQISLANIKQAKAEAAANQSNKLEMKKKSV